MLNDNLFVPSNFGACSRRYEQVLRLFRPRSASTLQAMTSWWNGKTPEFSDPRFPSYAEGREGAFQFRLPSKMVLAVQIVSCAAHDSAAASNLNLNLSSSRACPNHIFGFVSARRVVWSNGRILLPSATFTKSLHAWVAIPAAKQRAVLWRFMRYFTQ